MIIILDNKWLYFQHVISTLYVWNLPQSFDVILLVKHSDFFGLFYDGCMLYRAKLNPLTDRVLIVYPWTERYFGGFGDMFTATAVLNNSKVAAQGKVVLKALDRAVKNMDNIKGTYAALSRMHYEKLNVDPDNFRVRSTSQIQGYFQQVLAPYLWWCCCCFVRSCWQTASQSPSPANWRATSALRPRPPGRSSCLL